MATHATVEDHVKQIWEVDRLWRLASDLVPFPHPVGSVELDEDRWFCGVNVPTLAAFMVHKRRVDAADLSFPIILGADGRVMDGLHRILKALDQGLDTVQAVQFPEDPPPDRREPFVAPQSSPPFHLAFPVTDLEATERFFVEDLGAVAARRSARWTDFDFWGHQLTAHLGESGGAGTNDVDGEAIPVRHFGVVLTWSAWEALAARVRRREVCFRLEPGIRFAGEVGEQGTFFLEDPSGNVLEFKAFRDATQLFAVASSVGPS